LYTRRWPERCDCFIFKHIPDDAVTLKKWAVPALSGIGSEDAAYCAVQYLVLYMYVWVSAATAPRIFSLLTHLTISNVLQDSHQPEVALATSVVLPLTTVTARDCLTSAAGGLSLWLCHHWPGRVGLRNTCSVLTAEASAR